MKLFKKALLATAIFGAIGAQAATVSSEPLKLSAEGVQAGNTADDIAFDLDVVINKATPSNSTITLTFSDKVDLSDLETLAGGEDEEVAIYNDITAGKGAVDFSDSATNATSQGVLFDYGTGSFTFDRFSVNADAGTITFDVNLGNAITANSAFRISFDSANAGVDLAGASTVTYSSVDAAGDAIETGGTEDIAITATQFEFAVLSEFDGRIERINQTTFSSNGELVAGENVSYTDSATVKLTNYGNYGAALDVTTLDVVFEGNFDNGKTLVVPGDIEDPTNVNTVKSDEFAVDNANAAAPVVADSFDKVTTAVTLVDKTIKESQTIKLTFQTADDSLIVIPQTGGITAKLGVNSNDTASFVSSTEDAGEWKLDAVVVNIPYFPVGFDGLSTSVHFANESGNNADVIVTAIDQKGEKYSGNMAELAGNTVTKYTQVAIMDALKAPAGSKLSVTFNIDANNGDVNAYAFSNGPTGRQALVTSQEKGIK